MMKVLGMITLLIFVVTSFHIFAQNEINCQIADKLSSQVERWVSKHSKPKRTTEQLKKLYQNSSEEGVTLTLFNPIVFDKHVMMVGLAFSCYTNLKEVMMAPSIELSANKNFFQSWRNCARDLYKGNLPPPADQIEKLWSDQIKLCEQRKK